MFRCLVCLIVLAAICPGVAWATPGRSPAVREVILDLYDCRTRTVRQVVQYLAPGQGHGSGLPPLDGGASALDKRLGRGRGEPDLPGRSPADIARLASGGLPEKTTGTWRALCLLVDFSDRLPQSYPGAAGRIRFNRLLFSDRLMANGSFRDYYREISYGQFLIGGDVAGGAAGWYRAPRPYSYYTNNASGMGTYPNNCQKLVEELVDLADPDVDFSRYDNDRDRYVDALLIVHAGPEAASLPAADAPGNIHSHKWRISDRTRDGVTISAYTMQAENSQVGTFAHEFGHALGLPDLYDTDSTSEGVGQWSLMSAGVWLKTTSDGDTPAHLDAWCKTRLGWLSPTVVRADMLATKIPPVETSSVAYSLWREGAPGNEYFLIENRARLGFDRKLPGAGLLVWHVDEAKHAATNTQEWQPGDPPANHYLLALEQADAQWHLEKRTNDGDAGDPYRGTSGNATFNAASSPNSNSYTGAATGVSVDSISLPTAKGNVITADLRVSSGSATPPATVVLAPETPRDADDLAATASGGSVPDGTMVYQYTWWLSVDGGRTYMRQLSLNSKKVHNTWTRCWQMWKARARTTNGTTFSDWRDSDPVTIIPTSDDGGEAILNTWYLHQHTRPAGLSDAQWNDHLYKSNGRSWATAFHQVSQATAAAAAGDLVLVGPGWYSCDLSGQFGAVTVSSTAPGNPSVRDATQMWSIAMSGDRCRLIGVNLPNGAGIGGSGLIQQCSGPLGTGLARADTLRIRQHQGSVTVRLLRDSKTHLEISDSTLTGLGIGSDDPASTVINIARTAVNGDVHIAVDTPDALSNSCTFVKSSVTDGTFTCRATGTVTISGNTFLRTGVVCDSAASATLARNESRAAPGLGLNCRDVDELRVTGNTVSRAASRGLHVDVCKRATVSGNTIGACRGGGMYLRDTQARVTANQVLDNTLVVPADHVGDYWDWQSGGGICASTNQIEVDHNVVCGNSAPRGGGIYARGAYVHDNEVTENSAEERAGGVYLAPSSARCENNRIAMNTATAGGGVYVGPEALLEGNTIFSNEAWEDGGGVMVPYSEPRWPSVVVHNVITDNSADSGGGVACGSRDAYFASGYAARLTNNTIVRNTATHGGGVFGAAPNGNALTMVLENCLVTHNRAGGGVEPGAVTVTAAVSYCDVFGNIEGNYRNLADLTGEDGNLCVDPRYAAPGADDFHLKSRAGRWHETKRSWVKDEVHSPCIDAGDPASGYANESAPNGSRVNIGAYGNTARASRSFTSMLVVARPNDGATGVPTTAKVQVMFRWPVVQASAQSHFSLSTGGVPVAGKFTWPTAKKVMRFTPRTPLKPGRLYQATFASGIQKDSGAAMAWSETLSFRTAPAAAPSLMAHAAALPGGGAQVTVELSAAASVSVQVLNLAGRVVATLPACSLPAGLSVLRWHGTTAAGTRAPAGTYLLQVTASADSGTCCRQLTPFTLRR